MSYDVRLRTLKASATWNRGITHWQERFGQPRNTQRWNIGDAELLLWVWTLTQLAASSHHWVSGYSGRVEFTPSMVSFHYVSPVQACSFSSCGLCCAATGKGTITTAPEQASGRGHLLIRMTITRVQQWNRKKKRNNFPTWTVLEWATSGLEI